MLSFQYTPNNCHPTTCSILITGINIWKTSYIYICGTHMYKVASPWEMGFSEQFPTSPPISNLIYFSLDLKSKSATISLHFRHAILNRNFITNMSQKLGTFISLKYFKALLKNWHEWEECLPISSHGSHLILAWTGIKGFYLTLRSATGATKIKVHGVIIFNSRDHRGHKFQE